MHYAVFRRITLRVKSDPLTCCCLLLPLPSNGPLPPPRWSGLLPPPPPPSSVFVTPPLPRRSGRLPPPPSVGSAPTKTPYRQSSSGGGGSCASRDCNGGIGSSKAGGRWKLRRKSTNRDAAIAQTSTTIEAATTKRNQHDALVSLVAWSATSLLDKGLSLAKTDECRIFFRQDIKYLS